LANSHVSISCAYDQCQADIATALTNKYSEGVTIHYKTINDLIFSCDAISSKVIRIRVAGRSSTISAYYGDAWTSGTTITNAVTFLTTVSSLGVPASMNMVLGTSFILLNCLTTNEGTRSELIIVGKATNGDSLVFGLTGRAIASAIVNNICKDITSGINIKIVDFSASFCGVSNYLYKVPLLIADSSSGPLILNTDGSPAGIDDLYMSSYGGVQTGMVLGSNSLLTTCLMYDSATVVRLKTALIAEW